MDVTKYGFSVEVYHNEVSKATCATTTLQAGEPD